MIPGSTPAEEKNEPVALTQFAKATGCSCKIAPAMLHEILASQVAMPSDRRLLVGNGSSDDAAVYQLDEHMALITTTDFFTPVVDDAYEYGQIAAANALSDVYAMGGKPILAIAILGWPVETLSPALAQQVLEGGRSICKAAGIPLAGGHSIITAEPFFGLAVNGLVPITALKQNNTAEEGDMLYLTKPIGTGILTTARKRGLLEETYYPSLLEQLTALNSIGEALGKIRGVTAMTDVTGFGLAGHLMEMAKGSGLSALLHYGNIPILPAARIYAGQRIIPDATYRNWNSYGSGVSFSPGVNVMEAFNLLPDPQTNGGLLIAVKKASEKEVQELLGAHGLAAFAQPIGRMIPKGEKTIIVD